MFAPGASRYLGATALALVVLTALVLWAGLWPFWVLAGILWALWVFFAIFLRDPGRVPGPGVVSAADGRIREVTLEGGRWRVSVFMNVTNVHVNRFPIDGTVQRIARSGAGFRPAYRPDAHHNLQCSYSLETSIGPVEVIQMTGIVARRLVPLVDVGSVGTKGDRLGMIVLGSRVDVLLPAERVRPTVKVGDAVHAGVSSIAEVIA